MGMVRNEPSDWLLPPPCCFLPGRGHMRALSSPPPLRLFVDIAPRTIIRCLYDPGPLLLPRRILSASRLHPRFPDAPRLVPPLAADPPATDRVTLSNVTLLQDNVTCPSDAVSHDQTQFCPQAAVSSPRPARCWITMMPYSGSLLLAVAAWSLSSPPCHCPRHRTRIGMIRVDDERSIWSLSSSARCDHALPMATGR